MTYRQTLRWRLRPQEPAENGWYYVMREGHPDVAYFVRPANWAVADVVAWAPIPAWRPYGKDGLGGGT